MGLKQQNRYGKTNISGKFIILMISSNDRSGNHLKCNSMGIDHYLIKPFDISDLLKIVNNSFPFLEDPSSSSDIGPLRNDIKILDC